MEKGRKREGGDQGGWRGREKQEELHILYYNHVSVFAVM